MKRSLALLGLGLVAAQISAQNILFDFENTNVHSPFPIDVATEGINAHLWATPYYNYSIQWANTMGFTPVGFSGKCVYPNSVYRDDLNVSFSKSLNDFSILYAVQELDCDSSARMRVTVYMDTAFVGTSTTTAVAGGTWPTATLRFASSTAFNRVVVHYDAAPPTGGDYGVIFMADNMRVTAAPVPEPAGWLALGLGAVMLFRRRR